MKIFSRRATLKKRVQSLEEALGYIYTQEDGYAEHYPRTYGDVVDMKKALKQLEAKKGKK